MFFKTVINKVKNSSVMYYTTLIFVLVLFCFRFIGLDKDLPPYGVGAYNAPDEGLYGFMGLNLYNYGSISPSVQLLDDMTVTTYTAYHLKSNIIMNYMIYICMKIFGDNYFGFRVSIVLISLINLFFIIHITNALIKKYGKNYEKDRWFIALVMALFTFSFPFLIVSRVVEPTILRMTFALFAFELFIHCKKNKSKYFWSTFVMALSVQLVYITNVFMFFPIAVCGCLYLKKNERQNFCKALCAAMGGGGSAVALCAIYYKLVWNTNFISNVLNILNDFGSVPGYQVATAGGLKAFFATVCDFWGANAFLFSLPIVACFLLLFPLLFILSFRNADDTLTFSISSVVGLFMQTLMTNDYIFRKAILIFPFAVFCLVIFFLNNNEFNLDLRKYKTLSGVYTTLICVSLLIFVYYRLFTHRAGTAGDFSIVLKVAIIVCVLLTIIGVFFNKNGIRYNRRVFACAVLCFTLVINIGCCLKYVFFNANYSEKNAMVSLNKYNDRVVMGPYSYGYTLYNNIKPLLLMDEEYKKIYPVFRDKFLYIDCSNENRSNIDDYFRVHIFKDTNYFVSMIQPLKRTFTIDGTEIDMALYGLDLSDNVETRKNQLPSKIQIQLAEAAKEIYLINKKYRILLLDNPERNVELRVNRNNAVNDVIEQYDFVPSQVYQLKYGIKSEYIGVVAGGTLCPIYGDVYGDIHADIMYPIYGDVYGNVYGNDNSLVYGNIYGHVFNKLE